MDKKIKVKMNEKREAVISVLKNAEGAMTLAEIAEATGMDIKTGTTNAMIAAGMIRKVGTRKVPKTVFVEVSEYAIGDVDVADADTSDAN